MLPGSRPPVDLYNMNPITIETSNYSTSDPNRGKIQLICTPLEGNAEIVTTKTEIKRMADNLKDIVLIQYSRDFQAPVTAGEQIGTMTYFPERGDPAVYSLTASRGVEKREKEASRSQTGQQICEVIILLFLPPESGLKTQFRIPIWI